MIEARSDWEANGWSVYVKMCGGSMHKAEEDVSEVERWDGRVED